MKKKLFSLLLIATVAFVGVSCSDDDDDDNGNGNGNGNNTEKVNEKVDGTYNGTMAITVAGLPVPEMSQKIYITKVADTDDKVKLQIKDFSYEGMSLGSIEVDNVKVTEADGKYMLDGTATIQLVVGECDVKVGGYVLTDGKCNFIIDVKVLTGLLANQIIKVDFTGQREAAQ